MYTSTKIRIYGNFVHNKSMIILILTKVCELCIKYFMHKKLKTSYFLTSNGYKYRKICTLMYHILYFTILLK